MKKIKLIDGSCALVDNEDFALLSRFSWYLHSKGYAVTTIGGVGITMHRLVIGAAPRRALIDHVNRNKLDNQRRNLRFCDHRENSGNTTRRGSSSGYRGVSLHKSSGGYVAAIGSRSTYKYLGYFKDKKEAARAYNRAAKEHFGRFACLNKI